METIIKDEFYVLVTHLDKDENGFVKLSQVLSVCNDLNIQFPSSKEDFNEVVTLSEIEQMFSYSSSDSYQIQQEPATPTRSNSTTTNNTNEINISPSVESASLSSPEPKSPTPFALARMDSAKKKKSRANLLKAQHAGSMDKIECTRTISESSTNFFDVAEQLSYQDKREAEIEEMTTQWLEKTKELESQQFIPPPPPPQRLDQDQGQDQFNGTVIQIEQEQEEIQEKADFQEKIVFQERRGSSFQERINSSFQERRNSLQSQHSLTATTPPQQLRFSQDRRGSQEERNSQEKDSQDGRNSQERRNSLAKPRSSIDLSQPTGSESHSPTIINTQRRQSTKIHNYITHRQSSKKEEEKSIATTSFTGSNNSPIINNQLPTEQSFRLEKATKVGSDQKYDKDRLEEISQKHASKRTITSNNSMATEHLYRFSTMAATKNTILSLKSFAIPRMSRNLSADSVMFMSPREQQRLAKGNLSPFAKLFGFLFGHKEKDQFYSITSKYKMVMKSTYQDMDAPLSHYFISSGHNSYLSGNQFTSRSGSFPIAMALNAGCRVIELDVWNGKKYPKVVHGFTMTTATKFSHCIRTIRKYAFTTSEYPLIITLEIHCNTKNKLKIAQILNEELGDVLVRREESEKWKVFPSPNELKGKILIRAKHNTEANQTLSRKITRHMKKRKNSLEEEPITTTQPKPLADLITIPNVKYNTNGDNSGPPYSASRGESSFEDLQLNIKETIKYTQTHLLRTYPSGMRLDSSNYDPAIAWSFGAQIAALNWQTAGPPMWVHKAMFENNGGCGYIKKPDWMLQENVAIPYESPEPKYILRLKILSVRYMNRKKIREHTVHIDIYGAPQDCYSEKTNSIRAFDCGTWDREFIAPLRCPEIAVLLLTLTSGRQEKHAGHAAICLNNLNQGQFRVPLINQKGNRYRGSKKHISLIIEIQMQAATGNILKLLKQN
eukprot:c20955_g1_i2.p1 GENE.c20955_g1_i2~~c20955_g1_i2.p1  ORF type:complete len:950 (-),score=393.39 c20955_g1_i2:52-2901(-)